MLAGCSSSSAAGVSGRGATPLPVPVFGTLTPGEKRPIKILVNAPTGYAIEMGEIVLRAVSDDLHVDSAARFELHACALDPHTTSLFVQGIVGEAKVRHFSLSVSLGDVIHKGALLHRSVPVFIEYRPGAVGYAQASCATE